MDACYEKGPPLFFFLKFSLIWELKTSPPKLILEGRKTALLPDEQMPSGLAIQRESSHPKVRALQFSGQKVPG